MCQGFGKFVDVLQLPLYLAARSLVLSTKPWSPCRTYIAFSCMTKSMSSCRLGLPGLRISLTYICIHTLTYRHAYIQADRRTDRQTDTQTDRRTDTQNVCLRYACQAQHLEFSLFIGFRVSATSVGILPLIAWDAQIIQLKDGGCSLLGTRAS